MCWAAAMRLALFVRTKKTPDMPRRGSIGEPREGAQRGIESKDELRKRLGRSPGKGERGRDVPVGRQCRATQAAVATSAAANHRQYGLCAAEAGAIVRQDSHHPVMPERGSM